MSPAHVTVVALLVAVALVAAVTEIVVCVGLLTQRDATATQTEARLCVGLLAAVVTHLAVYYVTHRVWIATACVVPFGVVVAMRTPRGWQPPPRHARAMAGTEGAPRGDVSAVVQPIGDTSASNPELSETERQAWDSIRRSFGEP